MSIESSSRHVEETHGKENRLSMAMENYLLSILRLQEQEVRVTPAQLSEHFKSLPTAEGLGTSLPSVSAMIRRMIKERLVTLTPSKEVSLTKEGRTSAESMVRRHRLAERLAVDVLNVDLKRAHEEAHRLEHAVSPYLESKIVEVLGNPTTCPFGHPIPGSPYKAASKLLRLSDADVSKKYTVDRIPEDDAELLDYFVDNDFMPEEAIEIIDASRARGVIAVATNNGDLVFSIKVATIIWVRPS